MTPISESSIRAFVHGFYGKVRGDERLGPIFASRIEDWDVHLDRMCDFWSTVLLGSRRFHGDPMAKHIGLDAVPADFTRWLDLFGETLAEIYPPETAALVRTRAERIALALQSRMFGPAAVFPIRSGTSGGPTPDGLERARYPRTDR